MFFSLWNQVFAKENKIKSQLQKKKTDFFVDWSAYQSVLNKVIFNKKLMRVKYGSFQHNSVNYHQLTRHESIPPLIARQIYILKKNITSQILKH